MTAKELEDRIRAHPSVQRIAHFPGKPWEVGLFRHGVKSPGYHSGATMEEALTHALAFLYETDRLQAEEA